MPNQPVQLPEGTQSNDSSNLTRFLESSTDFQTGYPITVFTKLIIWTHTIC